MSLTRIAIVDDHSTARAGLASLIEKEPEMVLDASLASRADAITYLREARPDVLLVDISLQDGNGLELISTIAVRHSSTRILVVSMHDEALFAERCIRAGALGYVCKTESADTILEAIQTVARGDLFLSAQISARLVGRLRPGAGPQESELLSLSDRELAVYESIGQGLTVNEIAGRLHISRKTVENYRDRIRAKLGVDTAADLTRQATVWVLTSSVRE